MSETLSIRIDAETKKRLDTLSKRSRRSKVLRTEPAIDFLTAHGAGLRKMKDPEVIALAEQRRMLVSHVGTMPAYFRAFRDAGTHSPGVREVADGL